MTTATGTRFKFFWAHQDHEQEAWLRDMAKQGLHLESVHYWCAPLPNGREPEIFTDGASKVKKFQRLLGLLVCSALPMFIMLLITDKQSLPSQLSLPSLVIIGSIYIGYFLMLAYTVLRLLLRIRAVRAPQLA
jgi:hypothetical protein